VHKMENISALPRKTTRTIFREKRQALSPQQQTQASDQILATCITSTKLTQVNTIACYLANDGEISSRTIIEYCWQQNKSVLLPVLHPFCKGHLLFVEYKPDTPMSENCYGIEEPIVTSQNLYPLANIDVIFTPLVAFDIQGNRLGMGGGYYDRTLAPIPRDALKTQLIGLAHSCQQSDRLLSDHWDIPLNGIATPQQFFNIS
jgi:5-formyltetrahydrofolate cyclo-ligase